MATNSMVPYSNPAGNNQTSPAMPMANAGTTPHVPTATPLAPTEAVQNNPLIPATAMGTPAASTVPGAATAVSTGINNGQSNDAFYQQLQDIYGATGDQIFNFMNSISGTSAKTLEDYTQSLQPQFAKSSADVHASLGAGGVSANSSVTGIADASLKAQEDAMVAGESANLLQHDESLQANILGGLTTDARNQVSDSSGWNTFAQILSGVGGLTSSVMGLGDLTGGLSGLFKGSSGGNSTATVPTSGDSGGWGEF